MANPNRTGWAFRNSKFYVSDEEHFNTRTEAETWLSTYEGDRKRVTQFRVGKRGTHQYKYAARVYRKVQP